MILATLLFSYILLALSTSPDAWPSCQKEEHALQAPQPFFTDVREFIRHPDSVRHKTLVFDSKQSLGMVLRETPHENGEIVDDVVSGSQAWTAGVRKGWIITAVNGKKFSTTERLNDLEQDFSSQRQAGATLTIKYDVRTAIDCANSDCTNSDRFPTDSTQHCSMVCRRFSGCMWWSFLTVGADTMCMLYGSAAGFTPSKGVFSGMQSCAPIVEISSSSRWPECVTEDADLHFGKPLFTDVRQFIDYPDEVRYREVIFTSIGNIGMALHDDPHALGELVSDVLPASQAEDRGVRKGWIIKEVAGRPFKRTEGLQDIAADFAAAKGEAPTLTVKFDVRSSLDCTNADCKHSDKFPAISQNACAEACGQVTGCASWSFKAEEEDHMCWLRSDVSTLRLEAGSVVGIQSCRPPKNWNISLVGAVLVVVFLISRRAECMPLRQMLSVENMTEKSPPSISTFMVELGLRGREHSVWDDEFSPLVAGSAPKSLHGPFTDLEL